MSGSGNVTRSDLLERAIELLPLVRDCADEAERERRIPERLASACAKAGLHRLAAPRSLGGFECDPRTQIEIIELVSAADGAAGWTLMIGIEILGFLGPALEERVASEIYADPSLIGAGALNPLGRAVRVPDGYRVSGQWPFASGCHNAHYFWGQCVVDTGEPSTADDGSPATLREALIPASQFDIVDTWHVSGLRGSGSHDVVANDVFVPDDRMTAVFARAPRVSTTLFRFPSFNRLAYNKVGVSLGIARGALDHFYELARHKKPRASALRLSEKVSVQLAVAEAEATLRSARAFVLESVERVWRVTDEGRTASAHDQALVHLACTHACEASIRAVDLVCAAAGTTANFESSPLERRQRDVRVVPQHMMVGPQWKEFAARVFLG